MPTPRQVIAHLCRQYGSQLHVPASLAGDRVLWALAGCESEFGDYPLPKHEDGYCAGHRYDIPRLTRRWGCAAHCSYGAWQMMYPHLADYLQKILPALTDPSTLIFPAGEAGMRFQSVHSRLCAAAVGFINDEILGRQKATTLAQIAKAFNHGNWADDYDDSAYTDRAARFYEVPYPTPEVPDAYAT